MLFHALFYKNKIKQKENSNRKEENLMTVMINKIGNSHLFEKHNKIQDYCLEIGNIKMVLDGCSGCEFSHVGVNLFAQFFQRVVQKQEFGFSEVTPENFEDVVKAIFERMILCFGEEESSKIQFALNNLCFTILVAFELEEKYVVKYCGDGYILAQDEFGLQIQSLENEANEDNAPKYYIYNYIPKERLMYYQEGVSFGTIEYSKEEYKRVGVATDGLRYLLKMDPESILIAKQCLMDSKPMYLNRLINLNRYKFDDDFTICF